MANESLQFFLGPFVSASEIYFFFSFYSQPAAGMWILWCVVSVGTKLLFAISVSLAGERVLDRPLARLEFSCTMRANATRTNAVVINANRSLGVVDTFSAVLYFALLLRHLRFSYSRIYIKVKMHSASIYPRGLA